MRHNSGRGVAVTTTVAAAFALLASHASAQTATMAVGAPVTTIDPHFHNVGPNNALTMHIFDRLVERDGRARPHPSLAASWRVVSDNVWEFKLREGVTWHDGRPFTADDVVFTFSRVPNVPNSPGGFQGFLRAITRVEVVDPHTLRLHTASPHPLMPLDLASVSIIARHAAEGAGTEDFNTGRAAIGTGAYRLISYRSGDRVEMARNPNYFGGAEPWERVSYRIVNNDAARTAALIAGDLDLIEQVPTSDLARLRRDNRVTITEIPSLRTVYMAPDYSRDGNTPLITDNAGNPLPVNPFKDARVRRALSMAINREALVERVMEGAATATAQWLPEGAFGYNASVRPRTFDPDAAKRLLAEAGYPDGFRLTMHTPNDRWPNDARLAQAVAQMWTRIGVRVQVEALPWTAFVGRAGRQEYSAFLIGWGSNPDGSHPLRNILATVNRDRGWGSSNRGRYSNPQVDALLLQSLGEMDEAKREQQVIEGMRIAMTDVGVIPLHIQTNIWAVRRGFEFTARNDELTRAQDLRPAAR
jgi:peptide/nickel transport system substrate-binding protein